MRAKAIRERIAERKMIDKESDRTQVAQNLRHILNEMEAKGHRSEKLLRGLGKGSEGDRPSSFTTMFCLKA